MTLRETQQRLLARASEKPKFKPLVPESVELLRERLLRLREKRD